LDFSCFIEDEFVLMLSDSVSPDEGTSYLKSRLILSLCIGGDRLCKFLKSIPLKKECFFNTSIPFSTLNPPPIHSQGFRTSNFLIRSNIGSSCKSFGI